MFSVLLNVKGTKHSDVLTEVESDVYPTIKERTIKVLLCFLHSQAVVRVRVACSLTLFSQFIPSKTNGHCNVPHSKHRGGADPFL